MRAPAIALQVLRRPAARGALAGAAVLLAGAAGIWKAPRPARATATAELSAQHLPAAVSAALPALDAASAPSPAAALSDPVLRIAVVAMGPTAWPGLAGADEVELAAWGEPDASGAPRRRKAKVSRARLEEAVEEARGALAAEGRPETGEVAITATRRRAEEARALANAAAAAFAEWAAFEGAERARRASAMLRERQEAVLKRLTEVEAQIEKVRPDVLPDELMELKRPDIPAAMSRLAELESKLSGAEAEHRDLSAKVNDPNFTFVVDVDQDPSVQACMGEVLRAQARLTELEQRLGANDAQVKAAKAEVESWGTQLKAARSAAVSTMSAKERVRTIDRIRALGEQRDALRGEFDALNARVSKERKEWEDLVQQRVAAKKGAASPELAALAAEAEVQHRVFTGILTARLAVEGAPAGAAPVRVASPARPAGFGGPPDWALWGALAALAACAALVASRGGSARGPALHGKIRTEHDLHQALKIPILGCTPVAPATQLILHHVDSRHPFAEAYNTVAALVESYAQDHAARTFMITSATAGDGKTTLASNLGIALARSGQRVILIDADLRKGRLHEIFGTPNDRGTSEAGWDDTGQPVIVEVDALLKDTTEPGLRFIPAGPPPPNPVALLKGSAFKAMLAEAAQKADTILLDVPPVLAAVDPLLLTSLADGILFVAAAGETKREDVVYAKKLLENTHGRFAGGVLTKATEEAREIPAYELEAKGGHEAQV
ncbi:MAG: polysaccharide biosynthesis tyrosine autokinase [Planctomycetia bacterium]|nr:polysaccharide biosynthesis tyrosine autokinase [Planctomycetia bacterium]